MSWIIDGNNVLGQSAEDRLSVDAKRELVRRLASFARSRSTRVECIFDGPAPPGFACALGAVQVVFSGSGSADDRIVESVHRRHGGVRVVTSDRGLAGRVAGRRVEVISGTSFRRLIESLAPAGDSTDATDWEQYFSDEKNRQSF